MDIEKDYRAGIAEIDYSRDTLFGPIPMQATCRVRLSTVEQDGQRLRELTILGDMPDYLAKSSVIRVALEGRVEAGPIRYQFPVRDADEQQFKLLFENEHRRAIH
ncbi:MAG TPA: hypothetical protein VF682_23235 [Pseudomonas sp.]